MGREGSARLSAANAEAAAFFSPPLWRPVDAAQGAVLGLNRVADARAQVDSLSPAANAMGRVGTDSGGDEGGLK